MYVYKIVCVELLLLVLLLLSLSHCYFCYIFCFSILFFLFSFLSLFVPHSFCFIFHLNASIFLSDYCLQSNHIINTKIHLTYVIIALAINMMNSDSWQNLCGLQLMLMLMLLLLILQFAHGTN